MWIVALRPARLFMSETGSAGGAATGAPAAPAGGGSLLAGGGGDGSASAGSEARGAAGTDRAWLPEDLRADPALAPFADVAALAKSFKDTQAFVGADKATLVKLPKDEADAAWADVWGKLGRPEKPDGYKFEVAAELVPPDVLASFAPVAHGAGLSQKQAQQVVGYYAAALAEQARARDEAAVADTAATRRALETEWGLALPDKLHAVQRLLIQAGGQEAVDAINAAGLGRSLPVLKALARIAEGQMEPGALKGGGGGNMGAAQTPAQAQAAIGLKQRDPEFMKAYQSSDHAGHDAAVAEMRALYQAAYPTPAAA